MIECRTCIHRHILACGSDYCGYTPSNPSDPENTQTAEFIHDLVETGSDPQLFRLPTTGCLPNCELRARGDERRW